MKLLTRMANHLQGFIGPDTLLVTTTCKFFSPAGANTPPSCIQENANGAVGVMYMNYGCVWLESMKYIY